MFKRIITNPKLILIRIGGEYKLAFKSGDIYRGLVFDNAQSSVKKNVVITNPNFSIVDDNFLVNVNGKEIVIGHIGGGYGKVDFASNYIVANEFSVVMNNSGNAKVTANVNGKNIVVNGGDKPEPVYTNRLYYTVVDGGTQPASTWITTNCSDNVFDAETGEGYLVLNPDVTSLDGEYIEEPEEIKYTIFKDCTDEDSEDNNITSVVIPEQITSIGYYAFSECRRLTSITISNSVTSIGENAFYNCRGLTSVTIPDSITTIGDYAFASCTGLTSITIPNFVTTIGNYAFDSCSGLTSIIIPNSVTTIGNGAFVACTGLTSVTLSNSITSISNSIFNNCTSLTSITIPNSVTSIGSTAFSFCTGLKIIRIPSSVASIGARAFNYCTKLNFVTCEATTPPTLDTTPFVSIPTTTCSVPSGAIAAYQASDWASTNGGHFTTFTEIQ